MTSFDEASDARNLALAECLHGFIIEMDSELRHAKVWAADESLLVCPAKDMIGRTIEEVLGPVAGPRLSAMMREVLRTGEGVRFETPLSPGGRTQWILSDVKRIEHGGKHAVIVFGRDITETKLKDEALRASEERYRLAEQATQDVLYDWDFETDAVVWGAAAKEVLRTEKLGVTSASFFDRVHPEDIERVTRGVGQVLASGEASWSGGYRLLRDDGSYADVIDRAFIVRKDGRAVRLVGSFTDVTQMSRLQAQLVQAERLAALGLLAAGVGHEINNPLCYVIGNIDIMLDAGPFATTEAARSEEEDAREALREAREGAERVTEIVKGLRLFSRAEAGPPGPVCLHRVVESSLKIAENEIRHRARLVRDLRPVPVVQASEPQLVQVCLNLLVNAAQAIPVGGGGAHEIVVVTGTSDAGRVFFSVSDTGAGIAAADLDRIFDPFFTTKPVGVGTGIGLSVCMSLVQAMGGRLTVESIPNERTTFTVTLAA